MDANTRPLMQGLLERAGFHLRSSRRADCARCNGHSRGTVAFPDELAFCHRCNWSSNRLSLTRELGLLPTDIASRARLQADARRRASREIPLRDFERWREARLRQILDRYYWLSKRALLAHGVLRQFPDTDPALGALARFYHSEAPLSQAFGFLVFQEASTWLENDSTPPEVFHHWRKQRVAT
jgi:hypothetical protein